MKPDQITTWLEDLLNTLNQAAALVSRGRAAFDTDPALPLAFEALSSRVGETSKRLYAADPERFSDPIWSQAARNRDFVVHHYDRLDLDVLWSTVALAFPALEQIAQEALELPPPT